MSYFGFLAVFLGIPLILLIGFHCTSQWRNRFQISSQFQTWPPVAVILVLIVVAVIYTTPWDNYLVATQVWWYDPELVTGIVWGYVPIEEYTFFVVQTAFTGLYVWALMRLWPTLFDHLEASRFVSKPLIRVSTTAVLVLCWAISTVLLFFGAPAFNYLTLILSWALIPIGIQLAFGADILWHHRRLVLWGIIPPTLYLAWADTLAIRSGTWTISPNQTIGYLLFNQLPLEEFLFFLITNILVVFGMTLLLAKASHIRSAPWLSKLSVGSISQSGYELQDITKG